MNAKITIEFTAKNLCNEEDLNDKFTFQDMVLSLIKYEGLFGIVEDKFKIIAIQEL